VNIADQLKKHEGVMAPTIQDLARQSAMSATKLKNAFRCLFGLPIYTYFQHARMEQAKEMLLSGQYRVKEIGAKVGYTNMSHFTAAYKKVHGILPSKHSKVIG
jgi:AraC-like DNA-binding protein